jgi:hypothetical protein
MEEKLVATVSLCPICKPSEDWLGKYAYSEKVRSSGLWNSSYVFEEIATIIHIKFPSNFRKDESYPSLNPKLKSLPIIASLIFNVQFSWEPNSHIHARIYTGDGSLI